MAVEPLPADREINYWLSRKVVDAGQAVEGEHHKRRAGNFAKVLVGFTLVRLNAEIEQLADENQRLAELSALTTLTTLAAAMAFQNSDPAIYAAEVPMQERIKAARETALALHIADLVDRISEALPPPTRAEEMSKSAAKIAPLEMAQRIAQRFAVVGVVVAGRPSRAQSPLD